MTGPKRDIHQEITDQIIAAIEAGAGQWRMPWLAHNNGMPINATTHKGYRGVNVIGLWCAGSAAGHATAQWASFKQWQAIGAMVRKGEKGTMIVYYDTFATVDAESGDEKRIPFLKYSHVFNAAQVDGYQAPVFTLPDLAERLATAETFVASTGASVKYGNARAFYAPGPDYIAMPDFAAFIETSTATATENAYGTLLHELTHWTGHKSRCDRDFAKRFGSEAYAAEELVAELGAAFLSAQLGISPSPRADHAQYLTSWLKVLRNDKRAIFTAASKASLAVDHLNNLQGLAERAVA
jgi:antirestriction protein ArdC